MVNLFVEDRSRVIAKGLARDPGSSYTSFAATVASPGSLLTAEVMVDYANDYAMITLQCPTGEVSEQVGLSTSAGKRLLEFYQPDPQRDNPSDEDFLAHIEKKAPVRATKSQ